MVPNFESPDFPLLELVIPAVSDDAVEDVGEATVMEDVEEPEAVLLEDVGINVDDCREDEAAVLDVDVAIVDIGDEDDGVVTALLELEMPVLAGLLDPP